MEDEIIKSDSRKVEFCNGVFRVNIEQIQEYGVENIYNMVHSWKIQIEQMQNWQKNYRDGKVLEAAIEEAKRQLKQQNEYFDKQIQDYAKGIEVFHPVFEKWASEHPQDYSALMSKLAAKNARTKQKAIEAVQNADVSELKQDIA